MGSGVSRKAMLQRSDSRVEAILAEARKFPSDGLLLDFAPLSKRIGTRAEVDSSSRVVSGPLDRPSVQRWCHDSTATLRQVDLPVIGTAADNPTEDAYEKEYSDDFEEDEIVDWKKGASIGAGSYGTVYLARDEDTGSLMAVKEILISEESESAVHEAAREVEVLRALKHENIVKYLGSHVDSQAQTLSIFTEWVPGGSLEHNRKLFGGNERVVSRFTQQILSGVAYLHSKNIIHQDIKPTNILVDQNGVVKIADFGASRLIYSATSAIAPSSRSLHGTPNYMAPEVIKQTSGRSRKADIWSIGCTVLRLLTGRPLWGDRHFDSPAALLFYIAHLEVLPPLPDSLSPRAHEFIAACLQLDPAARPSAAELLKFSFVQGAGHKPDPVVVPVVTPRRHTAPVSSSPKTGVRRSRLSGHTNEAESTQNASDMPAEPTSLVGKLFSPRIINTDKPEDSPEKEEAVEDATLATAASHGDSAIPSVDPGDLVMTHWDDKPILTTAARRERERQEADAAEANRRRLERERKFQEELAVYQREAFAGRG